MELRDYFDAVRKRWAWVVAAVTIAVAVAALINIRTTPQYATSVTFFVSTSSQGSADAYQGGLFSQQRVKSYATLLTGDRLAAAVADRHDVGLTSQQIQSRVAAEAVPETVLLRARVTDSDRNRSRQVAGAVATEFVTLVGALEGTPGNGESAVRVDVVAGPVVDPAPVSPRPLRNLGLGLLLGLLSGFGLAVLRTVLDTTVRTRQQLETISSRPILGSIPLDPAAREHPLTINEDAQSVRAEAFRQLRTNLLFADVDRPVRSLVVTSPLPEEGKTTTAVNLALAFAEAGSSVLLIEADLRRPQASNYLGMEGAWGLTNVLAGHAKIDEVLQAWGDSGMSVLPSGFIPPNPSELLGSQQMADLLASLQERFDMVIIDTAPLAPVTDAAVVAAQADGAVMVVRCAKTSEAHVQAAIAALNAVDARVLGCVLNMAPRTTSVYSYYYAEDGRRARGLQPGSVPPVSRRIDAKPVGGVVVRSQREQFSPHTPGSDWAPARR